VTRLSPAHLEQIVQEAVSAALDAERAAGRLFLAGDVQRIKAEAYQRGLINGYGDGRDDEAEGAPMPEWAKP
jgi:hypothetical protein